MTPALRPMKDFNPSRSCLVYDELNDDLFQWREEYAESYRANARVHDAERDVMEWDGNLLAGWREGCRRQE